MNEDTAYVSIGLSLMVVGAVVLAGGMGAVDWSLAKAAMIAGVVVATLAGFGLPTHEE